jgi:hypothetical protein
MHRHTVHRITLSAHWHQSAAFQLPSLPPPAFCRFRNASCSLIPDAQLNVLLLSICIHPQVLDQFLGDKIRAVVVTARVPLRRHTSITAGNRHHFFHFPFV